MTENESLMSLKGKINTLFSYRRIPWLIESSKIDASQKLLSSLVELQIAIYDLDHQLESRWEIGLPDLKNYWLEIYRHLEKLGLSANQQRMWTNEIVRYQNRELDLRQGKSPLKYQMEDLYCFKSCDVRLMRRLIYWFDPSLNEVLRFSEWTDFDLITEVNDDVEDLYEDLESLNGNRFLISLFELGKEETRLRYVEFINQRLTLADQRLSESDSRYKNEMKAWLQQVANQTLELLDNRISEISMPEINDAAMIKFYSQAKITSP